MKFILIRTVTKKECPWLDQDLPKGFIVYNYVGYTYGCISRDGKAVSLKDDPKAQEPFFEIPRDSFEKFNLNEIRNQKLEQIEKRR